MPLRIPFIKERTSWFFGSRTKASKAPWSCFRESMVMVCGVESDQRGSITRVKNGLCYFND